MESKGFRVDLAKTKVAQHSSFVNTHAGSFVRVLVLNPYFEMVVLTGCKSDLME